MGKRKKSPNGVMKGEELLKFESVHNWLESLDCMARNRGKTGLTISAKRARLGRLLDYVTASNGKIINPDMLLEEARKDISKAGERLKAYFNAKVKSGISHNSAVTNVAFLRGFYTHNDLVFPKRYGLPKSKVSKVSKRDEKTALYDYDDEKGEVVFKNGTLQHFVQNLNFRDQTIALSLLSTGADATDLLKLNVDFVKDGRGKVLDTKRFFWHGNREKNGEPFKVFFSEEATEFLKRYVEQERGNANDEEPLFAKEDGTRLPAHSLGMNFRTAAKKMGYAKSEQSSPFRPKRFRHWFRTACGIAHVEEGYTHAMMGHASSISNSYLERNKGLFEMEYVKVEPFVTVFGINKTAVNEMSQEMDGLKDNVVELVKKDLQLGAETETLKKEVKSLTREVTDLKEQLKSAVAFIYSLEPLLNSISVDEKERQQRVEAQSDFNQLVAELLKTNPMPKKK